MIQFTKSSPLPPPTRTAPNTKMSSTAWVTRGDFATRIKNPRTEYSAIRNVSYTYSNEVSPDYVAICVQEYLSGDVIVYVATHDYTYGRVSKALVDEDYPVPSETDAAYCMYTIRSDEMSGKGCEGYTNMWSMLEIINSEIYSGASIPYHVLCSVAKNVGIDPPVLKIPSLLIICAMRVAGNEKLLKTVVEEHVLEERFRDDLCILHAREEKDAKTLCECASDYMRAFGKAWTPCTL